VKICIRAHDLGVKGSEGILQELDRFGMDGVQMVCYKAYDDVAYLPGGMTREKAAQIGNDFASAGKMIPLVGAYFNPVHSNPEKVERCFAVFAEYLRYCNAMGCRYVGSETGSFNDLRVCSRYRLNMYIPLEMILCTQLIHSLKDQLHGKSGIIQNPGA